jgi:beta-glucosidase
VTRVAQVDTQLAGDQTDLVKGNTYTWTGYVNVPEADTWTFWLQRPAGTLVGSPSGPNGGVNPGYQAGPSTGVFDSAALTVDGTPASLKSVSTLHPNDYKGGPTLNGQYLGLGHGGRRCDPDTGPAPDHREVRHLRQGGHRPHTAVVLGAATA